MSCTYFDCWFFILMCLSHGDVPSSLSDMEPKIPRFLLSHILASNSQTKNAVKHFPQFLWDWFLFSIIWASYKKKPKPELYTWMSQGSEDKWVI